MCYGVIDKGQLKKIVHVYSNWKIQRISLSVCELEYLLTEYTRVIFIGKITGMARNNGGTRLLVND